jgi:hypothetical protein
VAHQLDQEHGLQRGTAQWLAASLQRNHGNDTFQWGFDVEVATSVLPEFQRQDFIGMVRNVVKEGGRVHLVRGGANPRVARRVLYISIPIARGGTKLQT